MLILINHLGYNLEGPKQAIFISDQQLNAHPFWLIRAGTEEVVFQGKTIPCGQVKNWHNFQFAKLDFTPFKKAGCYYLKIKTSAKDIVSEAFNCSEGIYLKTVEAILQYFFSQRCRGIYDETDHNLSFFGSRRDKVDVHGGWYDASGDVSKYLTHLSYTNYMNPQQTPLVVWSLLKSLELLANQRPNFLCSEIETRILQEAFYGANFLSRMQDPQGYFYQTIFDNWTHDPSKRQICAYATLQGIRSERYQAGFRQGGGMAIAALAKAASKSKDLGLMSQAQSYLVKAEKGFAHLQVHNLSYLNDGQENIIDDYCALMASCELYRSTMAPHYLEASRQRAQALASRLHSDNKVINYWRADNSGERPYFHAAEAGLPVIALLNYLELEPEQTFKLPVLEVCRASLTCELNLTSEVNNPFGLARQYVKPLNKPKKTSFFMPHENESGYWWQGENSRLASLAAAAELARPHFRQEKDFATCIESYSQNQLNWILGLNPFDACMLHGFGRNNVEFRSDLPNAYGGICNGITSAIADEDGIEFLPSYLQHELRENWRWAEQWLIHSAWFLLAICAQAACN